MPRFSLILATCGRTAELHRFFRVARSGGRRRLRVHCRRSESRRSVGPVLCGLGDRVAIRHLRSSPGLSHARNVGLAAATGEVLAFPDDDCWYSPDLLRRGEVVLSWRIPDTR